MRVHILTSQEFTDVYKYSTEVTIHFGDDNAFLFSRGHRPPPLSLRMATFKLMAMALTVLMARYA